MHREESIAASINRAFDLADVIVTPLTASPAPLIEQCPGRGALRSLRASNTSAWLAPWNVIGQPALAVPTGIDEDGLPTSIHLAGRPRDETTLLRLAAQIEAIQPTRSWPAAPRS
jgi:amidase